MIRCFTSVTNNYLPKARVLCKTLKRHNPEWAFDLVLCEPAVPGFSVAQEPFDSVLQLEDFCIENLAGWIFKHNVVEICTAAKGQALIYLFESTEADKVVYLDPDIAVFSDLSAISNLLDTHSVLLTPHLTLPATSQEAVVDNEICAMRHGIYNLGFVAVSNTSHGQAFANWWANRLLHFCYDDIPNGLFTDQRWCDLAPALFEGVHILRKPEFNVASWNLDHRRLTLNANGKILVNNRALAFYHFTGFDSGAGRAMVDKYTCEDDIVRDLWTWYAAQLEKNGVQKYGDLRWSYDTFENDEAITDAMRLCYRNRLDLQKRFPNPFRTRTGDGGFLKWFKGRRRTKKRRLIKRLFSPN